MDRDLRWIVRVREGEVLSDPKVKGRRTELLLHQAPAFESSSWAHLDYILNSDIRMKNFIDWPRFSEPEKSAFP
jgi:hypothetical protein